MASSNTASLIRDVASGANATGLDLSGNNGVEDGKTLNASDSTVDGDVEVDIEGNEGENGNNEIEVSSSRGDSGKQAVKAGKSQTSPDKETITVSDEKGRRKVEIDYTNRDQIKKAHEIAAGSRKWQAERDAARAEIAPVRRQLEEMKSNWDTLETVHRQRGLEGVIDLLEGRQGAYQDYMKKAIDRQDFIRRASPQELEALQHKESAESSTRQLEQIRKENEEFRKQMSAEKESAELRSLESRVHPAFDKYRFADKLGDPADEAMFDQMLWRTAMDRLDPYEDQYGNAIPQEIIEKEFRAVSASLRKRINVQADKKASQVVEQKKREATENVQTKVQSGYKTGSAQAEAQKLMNQGAGGIAKIIQNMTKYGFNNKR